MTFFNDDWCGLAWTAWFPFIDPTAFRHLPATPGLYRIRAIGINELFYIGETGRNLRERLGDLRRNTMQADMPFNDPHTAAPSLWAWRQAEQLAFECSVAPLAFSDEKEEARKRREGLEFFLLWHYRLEFGASTRSNHGRFHPRYTKSSDRKNQLRGGRLADDLPDNLAGGPSLPPLQPGGVPHEKHWMGLQWSDLKPMTLASLREAPTSPGVYKIVDGDTLELLYVGETQNLKKRLTTHGKKSWYCQTPCFSFVTFQERIQKYQLHEMENDLLGGFYTQSQTMPRFQLIDHR
jgi:hypothetical protein